MPATSTLTARYYDTRTDGTPAGFYTDHTDLAAQREAYSLRSTGSTFPAIAEQIGFQHWDHAQMAVRTYCRVTGAAEPRSYTRRTRRNITVRRFGIEIEFNAPRHAQYGIRESIVNTLTRQNIAAAVEGYNHDTRSYWKMTSDATVSGGELVSPIMSGTAESLDEVREALRAVKLHGGTAGRNQGMHVHHDVTDFTQPEMVTLVTNLRRAERALGAFVPRNRTNGTASGYAAQYLGEYEWSMIEDAAANGTLVPDTNRTRQNRLGAFGVSRYRSINFNPVLTYGTVEFRLLGNTLNPIKVRAWIEVGQALIVFSKTGRTFDTTVNAEQMTDRLVQENLISRATADKYMQVVRSR